MDRRTGAPATAAALLRVQVATVEALQAELEYPLPVAEGADFDTHMRLAVLHLQAVDFSLWRLVAAMRGCAGLEAHVLRLLDVSNTKEGKAASRSTWRRVCNANRKARQVTGGTGVQLAGSKAVEGREPGQSNGGSRSRGRSRGRSKSRSNGRCDGNGGSGTPGVTGLARGQMTQRLDAESTGAQPGGATSRAPDGSTTPGTRGISPPRQPHLALPEALLVPAAAPAHMDGLAGYAFIVPDDSPPRRRQWSRTGDTHSDCDGAPSDGASGGARAAASATGTPPW